MWQRFRESVIDHLCKRTTPFVSPSGIYRRLIQLLRNCCFQYDIKGLPCCLDLLDEIRLRFIANSSDIVFCFKVIRAYFWKWHLGNSDLHNYKNCVIFYALLIATIRMWTVFCLLHEGISLCKTQLIRSWKSAFIISNQP